MRSPLFFLALALLPGSLLAQKGSLTVGTGFGFTQSDALTGGALHAQLGVPLLRIDETFSIRADALVQQGTISGPPSTCERVESFYCLGRSDRNRIFAAGTHVRMELGSGGGTIRTYVTPVGVGVYHRRTQSTEVQGPTGICIVNGQPVSCANNPPSQSFSDRRSDTAVGLNTGAGVEMDIFGVRAFAEARWHRILEGRGSRAGAFPLSFGVSF